MVQISQALDYDAATQEVGQAGDVFAIGDGLLEGLGERLADQEGKVGIGRPPVGVAVAVDGHHVVGVLGHHLAVGANAERSHFVVKGS